MSEKIGLMELFDAAEQYKIEAPPANKFKYSQYRTILKEAKDAIYQGDKDQLNKLIDMANMLTVKDLRLKLGKKRREIIHVKYEGGCYEVVFKIKQFRRVFKSTETYFQYVDEKTGKEIKPYE